jgi:hypothetical protein
MAAVRRIGKDQIEGGKLIRETAENTRQTASRHPCLGAELKVVDIPTQDRTRSRRLLDELYEDGAA